LADPSLRHGQNAVSEDLCIGGFFISIRGQALVFGSQPVSFKRINSIAIFAAARIPFHMELLVGKGGLRRFGPLNALSPPSRRLASKGSRAIPTATEIANTSSPTANA